MLSFFLSILFLPIVVASNVDAAAAPAGGVDFNVQVCYTPATCGEPIEPGVTLHVTNEAHPDVASTPDGEFLPYSATFPVPANGRVYVNDVTGGLFDVYTTDADGNASAVPVNPVVSSDESYVLSFNVMMPRD